MGHGAKVQCIGAGLPGADMTERVRRVDKWKHIGLGFGVEGMVHGIHTARPALHMMSVAGYTDTVDAGHLWQVDVWPVQDDDDEEIASKQKGVGQQLRPCRLGVITARA